MNFLEAATLVRGEPPVQQLPFLLAMSGTPETLELYVRAHAIRRGHDARLRTLPFNTLPQTLLSPPQPAEREVFLLLPWDLTPELDWRSGLPAERPVLASLRRAAAQRCERLAARPNAAVLYVPAPVPPVLGIPREDRHLEHLLMAIAGDAGADCLDGGLFSLAAYLAHGTPFGGNALSAVAEAVVAAALDRPAAAKKVLITDLDNTLWAGIVGEDGVEGVSAAPQGVGYRHFVYQSLLAGLQRRGVLLAAVSRNDPDLARGPLEKGGMALGPEQFVAISANYHSKSGQIAALAESLDLGRDALVFVDDNPVEIEEVQDALPEVTCLPFPSSDEHLPGFLTRLNELFPGAVVTAEDRDRTAMYRRRLAGMVPKDLAGADVTEFLRDLQMRLRIHDRTTGDRERAVQLINKTNQFNLNGRRWSDAEIADALAQGGRLYTAELADRHGSHGEILACLVTATGVVPALVMSCRVLQRRVEQGFLAWLMSRYAEGAGELRLLFEPTQRNTPLRLFLRELSLLEDADRATAGELVLGSDQVPQEALALFQIETG